MSESAKTFAISASPTATTPTWPFADPSGEYLLDAIQRTILFWDVLRRRSNDYYEHKAMVVPHVLRFDAELVLDGRTFERPANYLLARIQPPIGVTIDPKKRPFVVVDPRAGHGPGIGGFKADSELGVAMRAVIRATSSASRPIRCRGRPSRTSCVRKRYSLKRLSRCTPMPKANLA